MPSILLRPPAACNSPTAEACAANPVSSGHFRGRQACLRNCTRTAARSGTAPPIVRKFFLAVRIAAVQHAVFGPAFALHLRRADGRGRKRLSRRDSSY